MPAARAASRDLRIEDREAVVVLARDHDVLHPRVLGDAHPLPGVELDGVELAYELLVLGGGDLQVLHDPLADLLVALSLVLPGGDRVEPPVDEHPETGVAPPGHARVALFPGLGGKGRLGSDGAGEGGEGQGEDEAARADHGFLR
jgi:hypothetical protein